MKHNKLKAILLLLLSILAAKTAFRKIKWLTRLWQL